LGLWSWFKKRIGRSPPEAEDPVKAFDQRLDTLGARASELRRSAATLLAARGEIDRAIVAAKDAEQQARARLAQAAGRADIAAVLEADAARAVERQQALKEQREKLETEAKSLAETVGKVEADAEVLRREREAVQARWASSRTVGEASNKVLVDSFSELAALERARDEVERAQALAEITREDLARSKKR
jgi:phage shock protein A